MPSPRFPSRPIARRSITPGPEQELAVAVATRNRRGNDAGDGPAERGHEGGDVLAYSRMDLRIAHNALLAMTATGFELRLDKRDHPGGRLQQRDRRRQRD